MQTSYSQDLAPVAFPGQYADSSPEDTVTAVSLRAGAITTTATPANTTAYQLSFTAPGVAAVTVDYTSDGSATAAEIYAGLAANALTKPTLQYDTILVNGVLTLVPKPGTTVTQVVTNTGAGTIVLAANTGRIPFGAGVVFDADAKRCRLPAAAGDVGLLTIGVALSTHFMESDYMPSNPNAVPAHALGAEINVCRRGRVWVTVEQAVLVGDQAFLRHTANGALLPGGWRKDVDTANAVALSGAKFITAANAGGYAILQLNIV